MLSLVERLLNRIFRKKIDVYSLRERNIYQYHNGVRIVKSDPLTLYKKLMSMGPQIGIDMKVATSPHPDNIKCHTKVVEKIREVFDLVDYKDGGLTEEESIILLVNFLDYVEDIKKKSSLFPTFSVFTVPSAPISPEGQTTPNTSDSGSVLNDSSIVKQEQPPSEPESPSAASTQE